MNPDLLAFLAVVVAAALVAAVAWGIAWIVSTAWAWLERSDSERGLSFRTWLRAR